MLRLGLCCIFRDEPIQFKTTTAAALSRMSRADGLAKLSGLCRANAIALQAALEFCKNRRIGCFRMLSQILPVKTHPQHRYAVDELPDGESIIALYRNCGRFAAENGLRLAFHPDQFVVLNSLRPEVIESSLAEIEYQAEVAEWVGADVINIHGGGAFGDKSKALDDLRRNFDRLSERAHSRLTLENDDKIYTPNDLLQTCKTAGLPLVYDVHHHRVLPDGLSVEEATEAAIGTWNREPMFHLSSPIEGWDGPDPRRHHDFIDPADFPACWRNRNLTVEVEAKAKEAAVLKLLADLSAAPSLLSARRTGTKRTTQKSARRPPPI